MFKSAKTGPIKIPDPYHHLADPAAPSTVDFVEKQSAFAKSYLSRNEHLGAFKEVSRPAVIAVMVIRVIDEEFVEIDQELELRTTFPARLEGRRSSYGLHLFVQRVSDVL